MRSHIAVLTKPECCSGDGERCIPECTDIEIECPGVADDCRMWLDCPTCEPSTVEARDAFSDGEDIIHGVEHQLIDGRLMTATDRCFIATHDHLSEAGDDLPGEPGRYPVEADFGDGTELNLTLEKADYVPLLDGEGEN